MADNCIIINPVTNMQQCVVINSDIGNVPTGGVGISWNFAMEQFVSIIPISTNSH